MKSFCIAALLILPASLSVFAQAPAPAPPAVSLSVSSPLAPPPALNGIAHIAIRVKDVAASVAFYHKLGFDQAFANTAPDGTTITQSFIKINDRQFIEIYPLTPRDTQVEFLHLCFEGADLNAIHDAYVAEGLTPISVRTAGAGNLLFTMKGPMQFAGPQNIEYTEYMPNSRHSRDFGQQLGPDRVGDKLTVVALSMQDPAAATEYYISKLGFTPSKTNPALLDLPGKSGQSVEIVSTSILGSRSSIVLSSASLEKAAAQLNRQQVAFQRASSTSGKVRIDMISITDPDGNVIRLEGR